MVIQFVKAVYQEDAPMPSDYDDYMRTLQEVERCSLSSQLYHLLLRAGRLEQTPADFQRRLQENAAKALYRNIYIRSQQNRILDEFERNGIQVIPLKGTRFAEKYFGHIGARGTSDIDLLIKPVDFEKAARCIAKLGFDDELDRIPEHFHRSFSKNIEGSPIPLVVELHWEVLRRSTCHFDVSRLWKEAGLMPPYQHVYELSDEHAFYLICLHGWRHNMDSMKYFIDIVQLIHQLGGELDYFKLFAMAKQDGTLKRITRTLSIVYDQFPHLEQFKPLPYRSKVRWRDEDTFRTGRPRRIKHYLDYIDYQFFSYDRVKHGLSELRVWLFFSKSRF